MSQSNTLTGWDWLNWSKSRTCIVCKGIRHVSLKVTVQTPGPEGIKLFSCSTQLRLKFILLINVEMPTIVNILTFMSRVNY